MNILVREKSSEAIILLEENQEKMEESHNLAHSEDSIPYISCSTCLQQLPTSNTVSILSTLCVHICGFYVTSGTPKYVREADQTVGSAKFQNIGLEETGFQYTMTVLYDM